MMMTRLLELVALPAFARSYTELTFHTAPVQCSNCSAESVQLY